MDALLGQLTPSGDPAEDTASVTEALERNPTADLAVFPELFIGGYETEDPGRVALDPAGSEELETIGSACGRLGTAVICGFTEETGEGTFANSAACFGQDGRLTAVYRKTNLFGDAEKATFEAGDELVVAGLAGTAVGPLICFDMEFPEPARALAGGGARLLVTIAANMAPYGPDHRIAAQARALDNRLNHLYVNRLGTDRGIEFVGGSCLVTPSGAVHTDLGAAEGVFKVTFDPAAEPAPDVDYLKQLRRDLVVTTHQVPSGGGS